MEAPGLLAITALVGAGSYFTARSRAWRYAARSGGVRRLGALPVYYAVRALLWCVLPALGLLLLWLQASESLLNFLLVRELPQLFAGLDADQEQLLLDRLHRSTNRADTVYPSGSDLALARARLLELHHYFAALGHIIFVVVLLSGTAWGIYVVKPYINARLHVERALQFFMICCAGIAVMSTLGIVLSILFQSIRFFDVVALNDFLFGLEWSPQIALRENQVASQGTFGVVPLLLGTMLISAVAMLIAAPVGLSSAIYLSEYADSRLRTVAKSMMEILAGIPTVVYGVFAALTVAPLMVRLGAEVDTVVSPESALAAGVVMGVMIIPLVSSLSNDVINAVPQSLREGAYALGATPSETVRHVVLPAALPGIAGSMLLAVSRAIGETMIVVMASGLAARLTVNPLESVTTITVQIVSLLVGDQEFDNPKTLAAFALGLFLFVITLCLNVVALWTVRRYQERYE